MSIDANIVLLKRTVCLSIAQARWTKYIVPSERRRRDKSSGRKMWSTLGRIKSPGLSAVGVWARKEDALNEGIRSRSPSFALRPTNGAYELILLPDGTSLVWDSSSPVEVYMPEQPVVRRPCAPGDSGLVTTMSVANHGLCLTHDGERVYFLAPTRVSSNDVQTWRVIPRGNGYVLATADMEVGLSPQGEAMLVAREEGTVFNNGRALVMGGSADLPRVSASEGSDTFVMASDVTAVDNTDELDRNTTLVILAVMVALFLILLVFAAVLWSYYPRRPCA